LSARAAGLDMNAQVSGGWQKSAGWSGEVQALRNSGPYSLQLRAPAALRVAPGRVELGGFDATLAAGRLRIKELVWSEKRLQSSGEFTGLPAHWLVLAAGLAERVRSTLLLDGAWNLASAPRLTGEASLRRSAGDLVLTDGGELALGLDKAALQMSFADGRMKAAAEIASRYATASVNADIAPEPGAPGIGITPRSALSFEARIAGIDLRAVAQPFLDEGRVDGRVAATLRGKGTLAEPSITGSVSGDAIGIEIPPLGIFLKDGSVPRSRTIPSR
jgi:autotransporter translocation and assembly factor TamB